MVRPSFALYDASAGSGKTYTLVKEYLKIILVSDKNDAYRNILAITFTNKAVHEMKSRIVESLSEFAKDIPNIKAQMVLEDLAVDTHLSVSQIKTKSKQIIKHIIHNYASFDISTIDKFTHKVIRAFAFDLDLPLSFEVNLDTDNLLTEAVDAIIAQAGENETLTNLLIDFAMEKADNDKSWDVSREIFEVGKLINNENNRNEIVHFQNKTIEELIIIKHKLESVCEDLEKQTIQLATDALLLIENSGIDIKSFSGGYFPNHLRSIQDGKYNPTLKKYHESEDIKINKSAKDSVLIESCKPNLLSILAKIYTIFGERDFYKAFLKNITPLSLLNIVSQEFTKIQKEQNTLSISEFNAIIHNEIQNQPAPFIYERLGERYHHFFIDEFQDTSEMQWQNLIPLINNATSSEFDGEKGTLMIVGDPKQAIYRWRGGKAEQFIELSKCKNPFNNPDKQAFHLDKNYRSYSQIIEFNNDFFHFLSNEFENEDYKDLYANHSKQKWNDKMGGYVNISFVTNQLFEMDADENLELIDLYLSSTLDSILKVRNNGFQFKDIVILTRKRKQGVAVANYLTEKGIPIISSETLMIQNASEVQLIISVLKYIKNKEDIEAKANLLYFIAENIQKEMPLHDFISQGIELKDENEFEKWLSRFLNLKQETFSFKNIRNKSLYEMVESIISTIIQPKTNNGYIQYFLDVVLERDMRNQTGIADFLDYWEKNVEKISIPSPEDKDAVRIMTIHKAKGLEFPVVIIPFAEEDYTKNPKDKLWLNADETAIDLPKVLIDNNKSVEGFGDDAAVIFNQKKQEELLDNINILYVALTRAKEQLYVISNMNLNTKGEVKLNNMSSFFINYLIKESVFDSKIKENEFGNSKKISQSESKTEMVKTIPFIASILNQKSIKIAQKETIMWETIQQDAIEYGNLLHEIISFVKTTNDIDFAITKAIELDLITFSQKESIHKIIHEIVNHKELTVFFEEGNEVLNEKTIIQNEGALVKPDRIVITRDKKVYLLDYKTGVEEAKHKSQLSLYQNAIEKMGYKVVKKSLVYVGDQINVVNL